MTDKSRYKPQNLHDALVRLNEECVEVAKEVCKALRFGTHDYDPNDTSRDNLERMKREIDDLNEAFETVLKFDMIENHKDISFSDGQTFIVKGKDFKTDPYMVGLKQFLAGKYMSRQRLVEMFKTMGIWVGDDCIEWLMEERG